MDKGVGVFIPENEDFSEHEFLKSIFKARKIKKVEDVDYVMLNSEAGEMIIPVEDMLSEFLNIFDELSSADIEKLKKAFNKAVDNLLI